MAKLVLTDITASQNETEKVAAINANNAAVEAAIENTLSRDGTSPNEMEDTLDMNSNRIINLPAAASNTEPIRKAEFDDFVEDVNDTFTNAQNAASASAASATAAALSATNAQNSATSAASSATTAQNSVNTIYQALPAPSGALKFLRVNATGDAYELETVATLTDGDKGDITVSSAGAAYTIDNGVVTNAKLANVATATLKGRTTAGTGSPEDLNATQVKALLAIASSDISGLATSATTDTTNASNISSGTLNAARLPSFGSGDVSFASGGGAGTVANDAITNAKLANMAANSIKGNNTGSSADPIDLTTAQVKSLLAIASSDVSGLATSATTDTTNATNISSGTLAAARLPSFGSGDVSFASAGGAGTIANDAVTYAKMQNVSAASRILGRGSASGSGDVEELTLGNNVVLSGTEFIGNKAPTQTVFTASGTWNRPTGCRWVRATVVGGGGGAGGAAAAGASQIAYGLPAGAGGTAIAAVDVTSISSVTVTVGAGGAGGTGGSGGSAGSASSFGSHAAANGGALGGTVASGTSVTLNVGGFGGTATAGEVLVRGGAAGFVSRLSGTSVVAYLVGGASTHGVGGNHGSLNSNGNTGNGYGSGGSGCISSNSGGAQNGGTGADGIVIVEEFY